MKIKINTKIKRSYMKKINLYHTAINCINYISSYNGSDRATQCNLALDESLKTGKIINPENIMITDEILEEEENIIR